MLATYLNPLAAEHPLPQLQFNAVDLRYLHISVLDPIPNKLKFISELYLDCNLLKDLKGIQQFKNLQVLHFNFNYVSEHHELDRIKNKFLLKSLSYIGNPVQRQIPDKKTLETFYPKSFTKLKEINQVQELGIVSEGAKEQSEALFHIYKSQIVENRNTSLLLLKHGNISHNKKVSQQQQLQSAKKTPWVRNSRKSERSSYLDSTRMTNNLSTKRRSIEISSRVQGIQQSSCISEESSESQRMQERVESTDNYQKQRQNISPFVIYPQNPNFDKSVGMKALQKQQGCQNLLEGYKEAVSSAFYYRNLQQKALKGMREFKVIQKQPENETVSRKSRE